MVGWHGSSREELIASLKAEVLGEHGLALEVPVPVPEQDIPHRDSAKIEAWLAERTERSAIKGAKEAVVRALRHVRHADLMERLRSCVQTFNERETPQYCVVWDYGVNKSRRWIYELLQQDLAHKPSAGTYAWSRRSPCTDLVTSWMSDRGIRDFVIFDDAAFGGSQVESSIESLSESMAAQGQIARFSVVVPYTTENALAIWKRLKGIELSVIAAETIPPVQQSASRRQLQLLERLQWQPDSDCRYYGFNKYATFFDHTVPDARSFCARLENFVDQTNFVKPYHREGPYSQAEEQRYERFRNVSMLLTPGPRNYPLPPNVS